MPAGVTSVITARGETILDCIARDKRIKRRRRQWKFGLIEQADPDWDNLHDLLV